MGERTLDANRFDELARSLGHRRTRRGALGLLGGATGLALAGADAKRRGRRGSKRGGVAPAAESAVCQAAGSKTCAVSQVKRAASVRSCDYAGADLAGLSLNGGAASRASFAGATMTGMNLAGANLASACFADADLQGANLRGTNLTGADLTGADLRRADLRGSSASDAQIATAVVSCGTTLPNAKHPPWPGRHRLRRRRLRLPLLAPARRARGLSGQCLCLRPGLDPDRPRRGMPQALRGAVRLWRRMQLHADRGQQRHLRVRPVRPRRPADVRRRGPRQLLRRHLLLERGRVRPRLRRLAETA